MRKTKPFWKVSHQCWYVKIDGKQTRLDPDEKRAHEIWHQLVAGTRDRGPDTLLIDLIAEFLELSKRINKESTHKFYRDRLESFYSFVGKIKARDLKPIQVTRWVAKRYPNTTNGSTIHAAMRPIVRVMNWATDSGLVQANPLRGMKKPRPTTRDIDLTPEQYKQFLPFIKNEPLRELVEIMWNTGCRPLEARTVEATQVQDRCWVWPVDETLGKQSGRTIMLNERALEITTKLAAKYPEGPLFRTRLGTPWTKDALAKRFRSLSAKAGIKVIPYSLRIGFATNCVVKGLDLISISQLMGHADLRMLKKVYAKVHKRSDHLRRVLDQATDDDAA